VGDVEVGEAGTPGQVTAPTSVSSHAVRSDAAADVEAGSPGIG
jgi:hypothetical protein